MRVLVLPEWYPAATEPTSGVFVRDQVRAVARQHDVTVIAHDPCRRTACRGSVREAAECGVRTIRIRTRLSRRSTLGRAEFALIAARVLARLRRRGEAPDVIHAHVFSAGFVALMLSRGRYPLVVSEHHSDFVEGLVRGRDALAARLVLKHASLVCPVSSVLLSSLQRLEPAARYEVVPNLVDVRLFSEVADRSRPHRESKRLLVVALLNRQKGIEHLLSALAELARIRGDFSVDVVGDGPARSDLEAIARRRLPAGLVTFHGIQSREEVLGFMARAHAFVLPSAVETFGVAVIEAIAAGLPVVITSAVPGHEAIAGRFGLVVEPGDVVALADALEQTLDRQWRPSRAAALQFSRRFDEASIAERWDAIYRGVRRSDGSTSGASLPIATRQRMDRVKEEPHESSGLC